MRTLTTLAVVAIMAATALPQNPCPANPISLSPTGIGFDWTMTINPVTGLLANGQTAISIQMPLASPTVSGDFTLDPTPWVVSSPIIIVPETIHSVPGDDGADVSPSGPGGVNTTLALRFRFLAAFESDNSDAELLFDSMGNPIPGTGLGPNPISAPGLALPSFITLFGFTTGTTTNPGASVLGLPFLGNFPGGHQGGLPFNCQLTIPPTAWLDISTGLAPTSQNAHVGFTASFEFPTTCLQVLDGVNWTYQAIVNYPMPTGFYGVSVVGESVVGL